MRVPLALLALLLLAACAPAAPARAVAVVAPSPVASPPAEPAPAPPALPAVPPPSCPFATLPVLAPPTPARACAPVPASRAAAARAKVSKGFTPREQNARLAVTFACDPLGGPPTELVYESGSGHGQNLELMRLRRSGARIDVLRIALPGLGPVGPSSPPIIVERATFSAAALDAALPALRALLLATLTERLPADTEGLSESFSSGDFHSLLRLQDAAGHVIQRAFTGYPSSDEQLKSLPMAAIDDGFFRVAERIPLASAAVDADARAFFVERYLAAGPAGATWWVEERFVMLAEHMGTPALIPSLLALSSTAGNDASVERTRGYAVDTLAALTGFDARRDASGQARPIADAAADYARACAR